MPTAAELAAASDQYSGNSAFADGIVKSDFTTMLGKVRTRVRVWAAYDCSEADSVEGPNGEEVERDSHLYIEQKPNEEILVWRSSTKKEMFHADFGVLAIGQTLVQNLPDEIEFSYGDRILFVDTLVLGRCALTPSGESTDRLPRRHVSEILTVIADGVIMQSGDFGLITETSGISYIEWVTVPHVALITFRYHPEFTWLNINDRTPLRGADGNRLPQRGIATLQQRGEHDDE